jgi:hypothetical protein
MKELAQKLTGRPMLHLKKHSPEILLAVGLVGVAATMYLVAKESMEAKKILDNRLEQIEGLKKLVGTDHDGESLPYTEEEHAKDILTLNVQTAINVAQVYAPALALGVFSATCILASHNIIHQRNVALGAAYKCLQETLDKYKAQVERGATAIDGVNQIMLGDADRVDATKANLGLEGIGGFSQYSRIFNKESSPQWNAVPIYTRQFLVAQNQYLNSILYARGHLFLNEVYDALGLERSKEGAIVGWVVDKGKDKRPWVDFGFYMTDDYWENHEAYGLGSDVPLDFNVDGVIFDLI